jgi:hypothetical protein
MLLEVVRVVAVGLLLPPVEGVRPQSDPVPIIPGTEIYPRLWSLRRPTLPSRFEVQYHLQRSGGCRRKLVGLVKEILNPVGGGHGGG